jgi:multidrug efflux pump subunit AcrA (membrane-fusion protein)
MWYKIAADNPQTKLAAAQLAAVIAEQQRQDALNAERAQAERQQAEQARQQAIADGTYQEPEEKESRASRFLGVVTAAIDVAAAATGTDLNADSTPANYTPQRSDSSSSGSSSSTSNRSTPSGPNASICGRAINEATARANNCHY